MKESLREQHTPNKGTVPEKQQPGNCQRWGRHLLIQRESNQDHDKGWEGVTFLIKGFISKFRERHGKTFRKWNHSRDRKPPQIEYARQKMQKGPL